MGTWRDANEAGTGAIIWDALNGSQICRIRVEANGGTHSVAFSPNSKLVAIGSVIFDKDKANDAATGVVRVVHAATGITEWTQTIPGWLGPVAFTPDGRFVAVLCGGKSIRFLDTETGKEKNALQPADSAPSERWNGFAIASTSRSLAIGGINAEGESRGFVSVWSLDGGPADGEKRSETRPTQSPVQVCTFPLRFKLASDMADDLRQILLGRPGNEAKPSNSNQEIIVTAPPDVMSRARTFITVMDWPDRIKRHPGFRIYPR